jgi:phage-related protein
MHMSDSRAEKPIEWVASAKRDLKAMSEEVQDDIGYALDLAQRGLQADYAERMKGDLSDVVEIRTQNDARDSTFRGMYTTRIADVVYVLDVFQKKSKSGVATPKPDLDRIRGRLKQAREHYARQQRSG